MVFLITLPLADPGRNTGEQEHMPFHYLIQLMSTIFIPQQAAVHVNWTELPSVCELSFNELGV